MLLTALLLLGSCHARDKPLTTAPTWRKCWASFVTTAWPPFGALSEKACWHSQRDDSVATTTYSPEAAFGSNRTGADNTTKQRGVKWSLPASGGDDRRLGYPSQPL